MLLRRIYPDDPSNVARLTALLVIVAAVSIFAACGADEKMPFPDRSATLAGKAGEFGEPYGVAAKDGEIFISDGETGKIFRIDAGGTVSEFAGGFDTPSAIAFEPDGNLLVADSGSHTISRVSTTGQGSIIAGVAGRSGFADGAAAEALFYAPIGVAAGANGIIYVADTYNDRIRVIENGEVRTLAGRLTGFADGDANAARFDTPTGIAVIADQLIVADTGNRRIRNVDLAGNVTTLTGGGEYGRTNGLLSQAAFVSPVSVTAAENGDIYVADGNAVRVIANGPIPIVRTLTSDERGIADGVALASRFNRPSGIAVIKDRIIITDSENRVIRELAARSAADEITPNEIASLRGTADQFRAAQAARWPYDPPMAVRDIAGTLGEIRGEMRPDNENVWFHNGLDIAGAYGETARFIRSEKVLRPTAAENFDTLRELIRMPTLGYIHIRLGRRADGTALGDPRFQFIKDESGRTINVRVPRGTRFEPGDSIGTLNAMNHVHLIAGRSGFEWNAIDALELPGIKDTRPPVITGIKLFDVNWRPTETIQPRSRIKLDTRTRIVVGAFDQMDGNPERRRLGVYKAGWQLKDANGTEVMAPRWNIEFDVLPWSRAVRYVYADGSYSGATGTTIFDYIVTNTVRGADVREGFLDPAEFAAGTYKLVVMAADRFDNVTTREIEIEIIK
jgi:sugar lactone lactonase YvrE